MSTLMSHVVVFAVDSKGNTRLIFCAFLIDFYNVK